MTTASEQHEAKQQAEILRNFRAAVAHEDAGRRDRAAALYRKVLQKAPDHVDALHRLGIIAHDRGRHGRAIQLIGQALQLLPEYTAAHVNLGNALRAEGRREEAAESYRRALTLAPDNAFAHANMAAIHNDRGEFEAGVASAERAIELALDLVAAHINRSEALTGLSRFAEAETELRRACALAPRRAETFSALGALLAELSRFDEAVACHEQAIALKPKDALLHQALGASLYRAHRLKESEASYRSALALAPDCALAWHGLGNALLAAGWIRDAVGCFERAAQAAPDMAAAYHALAIMRQRPGDDALERLSRLLANPDSSIFTRTAAGFALGTFLDNADRYDDAFPQIAQANVLCRQRLAQAGKRFDGDAFARDVARVIARSTAPVLAAASGWGNPSEVPVFIVGMPRSGTSLVEQIAASHSRVFGAGERREIAEIYEAVIGENRERPIAEWDMNAARELANAHVARLQTLGDGALRVTDKMPHNILHLGLIAVLFPEARVIFCRRDGRDTCLSCYFQYFAEGHEFAYELADCGRRFVETERLAEHWRRVLPLKMLTVDYEVLVTDPEGESRRLIAFLGLDWEDGCLEFYRTKRPVFTAATWEVRQPMYSQSVGRWRHYERHLTPLLDALAKGQG